MSVYLNLIYYAVGLVAYMAGMPGWPYLFPPHAFASIYLADPQPGEYPFFQFVGLLLFAFALTTAIVTVVIFFLILLIRHLRS